MIEDENQLLYNIYEKTIFNERKLGYSSLYRNRQNRQNRGSAHLKIRTDYSNTGNVGRELISKNYQVNDSLGISFSVRSRSFVSVLNLRCA